MIDVLYPTWNRRRFTEFSFQMLLANTDWDLVRKLVVHDDGSDEAEGTAQMMETLVDFCPVPHVYHRRAWPPKGPPAVMNWYVAEHGDPDGMFAKVDSDIVVPPGWLGDLAGVMERNPDVELLGMEAGRMGPPGHNGDRWDGVYRFEPGSHIGGVGLMRTSSFLRHPKLVEGQGRFGFTEWQHEYEPVRGWIAPDLLVASLDQVPLEPWRTLTLEYAEKDWSRRWAEYHERWDYWWSWWPK